MVCTSLYVCIIYIGSGLGSGLYSEFGSGSGLNSKFLCVKVYTVLVKLFLILFIRNCEKAMLHLTMCISTSSNNKNITNLNHYLKN